MKAIYDNRPADYQVVGNGSALFRWDIKEVEIEGVIKYQCDEVVVWGPITSDKIKEAVIVESFPGNVEKKMMNDYFAAKEGLLGQERIEAYMAFLAERSRLKSIITAICAEVDIE